MRNEIPLDSPTIAALRGVVIAATNMLDSDVYPVAVVHWTRDLSRDELVEVVTLLGCLLNMQTAGGGSGS